MAKDLRFYLKFDSNGRKLMSELGITTEQLDAALAKVGKGVDANKTKLQRLNTEAVNLAASVTMIKAASDALGTLNQKMEELKQAQQRDITTSQMTGLDGGELSKLRNEMQALGEYFGKDYMEILRGVNSMSKGFGVSAQEAFSLLRDGMLSGADANGEFVDTLREYPRYFKEAGISAEAFVAIATNAAKQGVYSDKGVDAIKEGNLRLREMTKATADALNAIGISADEVQQKLKDGSLTTFQVMQMVGEKLKTLSASSSEVGTAIADIFGGPGEDAGLEYLKSLADIELNMQNVKAATGELAEQQEKQIATQTGLLNITNGLKDALAPMARATQPLLTYAATALMAANGAIALTQSIKSLNIVQTASALKTKAVIVVTHAWRSAQIMLTASTRFLTASMKGATVGATTLKFAIRGLMIASGVGVALTALTLLIEKFVSASDKAKEASKELTSAQQTAADAAEASKNKYAETSGQIALYLAKIEEVQKTHSNEKGLVADLNKEFGDIFGNYKTLGEWYDTLKTKGEKYCKMLAKQAELQVYTSKIGSVNAAISDMEASIPADVLAKWKEYQTPAKTIAEQNKRFSNPVPGKWLTQLALLEAKYKEQGKLEKQMETTLSDIAKAQSDLKLPNEKGDKGGKGGNTPPPFKPEAWDKALFDLSNEQLDDYIKNLQTQLNKATNDAARKKIGKAIGRAQSFSEYRQQQLNWERPEANFAPIPDIKASDTQLDTTLSSQLEQLPHELEPIEVEVKFNAQDAWNNIKSISSAMESLKSVTDESKSGWEKFTTVIDAGFQLWQAMVPLYETINALMKVNNALKTTETGVTAAGTAVTAADTNAKIGNAAAGFMAAHAWMPLVGIGLAGAAIGAMVATMFSLPKFAKGGIAYGPTLGLFGEYAGASHNPEVVAPLDKLKSLIGDTGMGGDVYFHINGDALEGVLTKRQRKRARG